MDEMSDLKSFTLSQYGEIYPMNIFESMHFDFLFDMVSPFTTTCN
nr:hypothetical protein [Clostridium sp. ZBS18]